MKRYQAKRSCIVVGVGFLVCLTAASLTAFADPWEDQVKQAYDYVNWGPDTGRVIAGIFVTRQVLPWLNDMWKVWPEDEYSISRVAGGSVSRIRQYWIGEIEDPEKPQSELLIEMVVGPSHIAVQEYLISRYVASQALVVRARGRDYGLSLGHLSFVLTDDGGATYSEIDFARHNVLFILSAEGPIQGELRDIAIALDQALRQQPEEAAFEDLGDLPKLDYFCMQDSEIVVGDSSPIIVTFEKPQQWSVRYLWDFAEGGIDRDADGRFVYIGDTLGAQWIRLTVINSLGLFVIEEIQIDVVP